MGLHFGTYIFNNKNPNIEDIINKASELSGLDIIKIKPTLSINVYIEGYHDYVHEIAFKDFQKNSVEVYTYKNGEDNHFCSKEIQELELRYPQYNNFKSVNLQNYLGQEQTLFLILEHALEELGGKDLYKDLRTRANTRIKYPITIQWLEKSQKKHTVKSYLMAVLTILLIPIMIPVNLIIVIFGIKKIPFMKSKK